MGAYGDCACGARVLGGGECDDCRNDPTKKAEKLTDALGEICRLLESGNTGTDPDGVVARALLAAKTALSEVES